MFGIDGSSAEEEQDSNVETERERKIYFFLSGVSVHFFVVRNLYIQCFNL